jgi:hypothetical protein
MCADGRRHSNVYETYSSTPSREEFLILMHIAASRGWDYFWLDEERAFPTAERQDKRLLYAKFPGEPDYYEVRKALYGTKDASRDYQIKVVDLLVNKMGFERLNLCSSMFVLRENEKIIIVLDHVDDFVLAGNYREFTLSKVEEFRRFANTCDPIMNADLVLGMEIKRCEGNKTIQIKMEAKIDV